MPSTDISWNPTRSSGLDRLDDFLPGAGRDYAETRNFDFGPGDRSNVSGLSPYIRHRVVTEAEVVSAAIARHGLRSAEKFVGETCWRTYWKGWLELRPAVWSSYRSDVRATIDRLARDPALRERFEAATSGRSGIGCVDLWAKELVEIGYLHNHARMWFASLWIFTLQLPWELGADFFLRHLLDGDPASNTLSWRWVAGLQTQGKTYLASASNIARFTDGRIQPRERFASDVEPLEGPPAPPWRPLASVEKLDARRPFALLLTEEDLEIDSVDLSSKTPSGVAGVLATDDRSPLEVGSPAKTFARLAMADALARASSTWGVSAEILDGDWSEVVVAWASRLGVDQVVTPYAPVGPVRERLDRLAGTLEKREIRLVRVRRAWDEELWPHATAGYFRFKKELEASLDRLGVGH